MNSHFEFAEFLDRTAALRTELMEALNHSGDEKVRALASDVPAIIDRQGQPGGGLAPLTVAFTGQYNAGKSTMISALTGRKDIPIDADVCTDQVTAYDWNGICLLDTPGIHAGHPDHDEKTYQTIDRADLLVYVITNALFDDVIGKHFRTLCFDKNKAAEMLLVINKMSQDPGTPEIKRPDIERVTHPLKLEDLRVTFIDALSQMEADEEDNEEDRQELFELSNFQAFIDALNGFVREKELLGRLTTPLFTMRAVSLQAEAYLTAEMPEERAAIELLSRKRGLLIGSRARLRSVMNGLMSAAASDLVAIGDAVAETIEPGSSEEDVKAKHEAAQRQALKSCERLAAEAQSAVETELVQLQRQLEALEHSVLASQLKGHLAAGLTEPGSTPDHSGIDPNIAWQGKTGTAPSDWTTRMKKVGDVAKGLGKYAARWATGPTAEGARIGSATAARGSQAHEFIYNAGKFFGVKFEPWGAVKVARAIGNAGRVIAAVGGVLAVVAQIMEDKQLEEHRIQLREARNSVRLAYRESVNEIEREFRDRFKAFEQDFYESELAAVDELTVSFTGRRSSRKGETERFTELAAAATQQIEAIQSND